MAHSFRFRAATSAGDLVEGVVRAEDKRAAADELRRQMMVPVSLEMDAITKLSPQRVGRADATATSFRTIATLLSGGATLDRALTFAADHAGNPEVGKAFAETQAAVQRGIPLSTALGAHPGVFGDLEPALARAGEESGSLDSSLTLLADQLERARDLRSQLRAALWYPALMGVVLAIGVLVLVLLVVPRFVSLIADVGGTLPLSTRLLVGFSGFIGRWWWLISVAIIGVIAAGKQWLSVPENLRSWHRSRLRLPLVGELERRIWTSRFSRTLGVMLTSGADILSSLRLARDGVSNQALSADLDRAFEAIERGERVSVALAGPLPPLAAQLLAVGEESANLDAMALRIADTYDSEVQRTLRTVVGLVEPVLIVIFAGLVGFVALALLQAIYSINRGL